MGHGHLRQGLLGGILRDRNHGDNHHNLPHLMCQYTSGTKCGKQAQGDLLL